jgi:hypothetical protein
MARSQRRFGVLPFLCLVDGAYPAGHDWLIAVAEVQLKRAAGSRSVLLGWSIALLACAAQTAGHLTNELVLGGRYRQLEAGADGNTFAWVNVSAIVALAVLVLVGALAGVMRCSRAVILAWGLALLAVDDATGFHDRLRGLRAASLPGPPGAAGAGALVAFAMLLALVFVLLWAETGRTQEGARWMIRAGLIALAAAVATRAVGAAFTLEGTFSSTLRAFAVAGEQGLDLAGWILVTAGYAVILRDSVPDQSSSPPPH